MFRKRAALLIGMFATVFLVGATFVYAHAGKSWGDGAKAFNLGSSVEVHGSTPIVQGDHQRSPLQKEDEGSGAGGKLEHGDDVGDEVQKEHTKDESEKVQSEEHKTIRERARAQEQIRATHEAEMQRIIVRARGTAVEEEILALPSLTLQQLEEKLMGLAGSEGEKSSPAKHSKDEMRILREAIQEELQYLHRLLEVVN